MSRIIANLIEMFAKRMAIVACGAASTWGGYQAKEPKNIFEK
ncbi:MAG: cyclic lactone autoinducer peptide [Ruminococcus sp.]|nr:cyclic lactone autoinducer peptide [Ruminococcus sp.]